MPVVEALLVGSYPAETRMDSVSFVANNLGKYYILIFLLEIHSARHHLKDNEKS